ncbi:MAG: osmoprotectant NAGGN system M42 family peptidase, partial [Tistlia sp.]
MSTQNATSARPLPKALSIDLDYLKRVMLRLLQHHSPTGYTDQVVHVVCEELTALGVEHELTRRGAIRASLQGSRRAPDRAVVAHLDTIGAMVTALKPNGRLSVTPIGTWSPRFAEGAEVTVLTELGSRSGTILPLKASGHTFDSEVDSQPVTWDNVELRVDELVYDRAGLERMGIAV